MINEQTNSVMVNDDFIFAVTDQELEINHVEPALVLSALVIRDYCIKAKS